MMKKVRARLFGKAQISSSRSVSQAGFTLLEIIIVLGILGTLMAVLVGGIGSGGTKAKIKETGVKAANIQAKLLQYQSDVGNFPSTADGLQALMSNPGSSAKWGGPYFTAEDDVKDAWNNPFDYELTAKGNKLVSPGADGQSGTEDDISYLNGREVSNTAAPTAAAGEGGQAN
jgi:general secretion pathway protein G